MKNFVILMISFLFSYTAFSQDVLSAFKSGDAAAVARYFDQSVEITIEGNNRTYTKKNAETLLNDFFKQNIVKGFEVIHKSGSGSSQYYIGNLVTSGGTYRTTIYTKSKNDKTFIQEIRFEK